MAELRTSTFERLRDLIYKESGISLGPSKMALVQMRLAKRIRKLDIASYEDYLDMVLGDKTGAELQLLLDAISTNVTSFYREAVHFEVLREAIAAWLQDGLRRLRIWSAACSTGEEPYTLAIEALDAFGSQQVDLRILATDIAPAVLRTAQRGAYAAQRVATVPRHLLGKYFTKHKVEDDFVYTVTDAVKEKLLFRLFNLSRFPYPFKHSLDVIFCRNVMIYFDNELKQEIIAEMRSILKPGGLFFVGRSETIAGKATGFTCVQPSVYRKS